MKENAEHDRNKIMSNPYESLTDEECAKAAQEGTLGAFESLLERYEAKITRYATRFLNNKDDAKDIAQEVFLKTYQNLKQFDTDRRFSPWLYRIAHNELINLVRAKKREPIPFFDPDTLFPHPEAKENTEDEATRNEMKRLLDKLLEKLEAKYREALILYYLEDMSYQEISDVLHIPIATVGVRLKRARERLNEMCKKQGMNP